ncbi:MAG: TIGR03619 family F420-dependent LLM class oxidoreductase [Dehalococcoidia bacterium]|nr:TIGR03619 family F420-dependent LLM class oxidoreductase [Dehalococcoidia bacterium]
MKFGIAMFPTDYAIGPAELAVAVEERGFDSLWFPEHTHIPASRLSPWPGGSELPKEYYHTLDPFVAFGAAAAVTTKLLLGTGICLVIERDPITLAKEVASLDLISDGRVLFGIGGGWNKEEMKNHGTDPAQRWKVLRERIAAMKAIWANDEAEYHGDFVDFDPIWSWPKPVQTPHPPIYVGGGGANTLNRVVEYGDGWMPIYGRYDVVGRIKELNELAAERGRDRLPVSIFFGPTRDDRLRELRDAGVDRVIFNMPPLASDKAFDRLDQFAEVAHKAGG